MLVYERRQYERYDVPFTVAVEFTAAGTRYREQAQVFNISVGGAYLPLSAVPEEGSELVIDLMESGYGLESALDIFDPGLQTARYCVSARVVRVDRAENSDDGSGIAVQFVSPLRIIPHAA